MPRLTGKNGALYISTDGGATWFWVADLYEWVVEVRVVTLPASIKLDNFDRQIPSHGAGRLTARRFVTQNSVLATRALHAIPTLPGSPPVFTPGERLQWAVVGVDPAFPAVPVLGDPTTFSGNANIKAQGTGYVDRGHAASPRNQIEDDFELVIDSMVSLV